MWTDLHVCTAQTREDWKNTIKLFFHYFCSCIHFWWFCKQRSVEVSTCLVFFHQSSSLALCKHVHIESPTCRSFHLVMWTDFQLIASTINTAQMCVRLRSHLGSGKWAEKPKRSENLFHACPRCSHLFCHYSGNHCCFRPHPPSLCMFVRVVAPFTAPFHAVCSFIGPPVIKSFHIE